MKKLIFMMLLLATQVIYSDQIFDMRMSLKVPRVYDNMESNGYRKYQTQIITGSMILKYENDYLADIVFTNLVNKTHKTSKGNNITYEAQIDDTICPRFNLIGSNKTNIFKVPSICFFMVAEPSYNISDEINEDNSLYLMISMTGSYNYKKHTFGTLHGYVTGSLGCGCTDYGHKSPTRTLGECGATDDIDDVAAVLGNITVKQRK